MSEYIRRPINRLSVVFLITVVAGSVLFLTQFLPAFGQVAPSTYSAYTGTDSKPIPPAPALGQANSVINDPTFGSRILRVTDQNTANGQSFIPAQAGFMRAFNANSTAIRLIDPQGFGYWLEFNPSTFQVGNGSSPPVPHQLSIDSNWQWSAVDPDIIYFLNGNQIAKYNKTTGVSTNLGGPPNGDPVTMMAVVVGQDNWVCSAAGAGGQDTYTEIFCVVPNNPTTYEFINVPNKTINGVAQSDPNWPTFGTANCTLLQLAIGIHSMDGSSAGSWLGVTFHCDSWGANGDAVLNLATNTWSRLTDTDNYWNGHSSLGNGYFVNGSGSQNGMDSRGAVRRDPNDMMNSSEYLFFMQPPTTVGWYDGEHSSWHNSASNPNAPVLFSRYTISNPPPSWLAWMSEIIIAAIDGSNTVWRFAHTHQGPHGGCFYGQGFAQISNDGSWALFSSYWDGTLGLVPPLMGDFGCGSRLDTFIVELAHASGVQNVVWTNLVDVTATGNSIQKTAGCDGCHAGATSQQQITSGNGYIEFTATETTTNRSAGLGNGNNNTSRGNINYAISLWNTGIAEVYESDVWKAGPFPYVANDVFRVAVEGGVAKYYQNGVLEYTSLIAPTYPLLLNTSLWSINATINNAVISGAQ